MSMKEQVEYFDKQLLSVKMHAVEQLVQENKKNFSGQRKIAIIMATHNRFSYLLTYIYSILIQENISVKFYISDDCSTDETCEYFEKLHKQYPELIFYHYSVENVGPSCNRKLALQNADEEFVIFADDDDYYVKKDFLSKAYDSLSNNNNKTDVYFGSGSILEVATGQEIDVVLNYLGSSTKDVFINLLFSMPKPPSTFLLMFKLTPVLRSKLLDMKMLNDVSIYLLVLDYFDGSVSGTKAISGIYRVHTSNITKSLNFDFMLINFSQQIEIITNSLLTQREKKHLICKHNKNNIEYYLSNSITTRRERRRLYNMLKDYGYEISLWDKWRYFRISKKLAKNNM